jgi:hypothetical protein
MPLSVSVDAGGPVPGHSGAEGVDHDGAGDAPVGGHREDVAGVVVQPGQDLDVDAGGQPVVGEVALPALVGLLSGEADIRRPGTLAGAGVIRPWRRRVRSTVALDTRRPWWCSRCQAIVSPPASNPWRLSR